MRTPVATILASLGLIAGTAMAADYSVPGDFSSIQAAVNAASSGDVITVGPGNWPGRLDFRGKNLAVQSSDGPESTTIDSNGIGSCVLFRTGEGAGAILKGFTISGGSGSMHDGVMTGGGIHIVETSPTIIDCIIRDNTALHGAGVSIWGGAPTIQDCTFTGNQASGDGGGIRLHHYSYPVIENCTFTSNAASVFGGAIAYGNDSDGSHIACIFESNTAGLRGGAIASACDCNDPNLWDSTFCNSLPDHILGGWHDNGGNDFCPVCAMDINADGAVDVNDVLQVINAWGNCICVEDVNGDTVVDVTDLLAIIDEWGSCPQG
ncbi:MAG: right-handed parallel beta-helix repeat-containing protein [Phycisphaerales bacterium]|nr:right-handed parallel beta-helix repeat-containing protein [Phycisphaerales bacterium]